MMCLCNPRQLLFTQQHITWPTPSSPERWQASKADQACLAPGVKWWHRSQYNGASQINMSEKPNRQGKRGLNTSNFGGLYSVPAEKS